MAAPNLVRGMDVQDTRAPFRLPVSEHLLGRMLNVFGQTIDNGPVLKTSIWTSIHQPPVAMTQRASKTEIFETGIKVIDVLTPLERGGRLLLVEQDYHAPARIDESGLHLEKADDAGVPDVLDDAVDEVVKIVPEKNRDRWCLSKTVSSNSISGLRLPCDTDSKTRKLLVKAVFAQSESKHRFYPFQGLSSYRNQSGQKIKIKGIATATTISSSTKPIRQ